MYDNKKKRFTRDDRTYSIDRQFLIGPAFLVTPVLEEGVYSVTGYFPASHWYDYYTGELVVKIDANGTNLTMHAPIVYIPLHIRGGYILPTQKPAMNTALSRRNPFGLIVAADEKGEARGDLYYDDGETDFEEDKYFYATFYLIENLLVMNVEKNNYTDMSGLVLDTVRIFTPTPISSNMSFIVNGNETISRENIRIEAHQVVLLNLGLKMTQRFQIEWTESESPNMLEQPTLIDCSPQGIISAQECESRMCRFEASNLLAPKCVVPSDVGGYNLVNESDVRSQNDDFIYNLVKADEFALFPKCVRDVRVEISFGTVGDMFGMTRIKV